MKMSHHILAAAAAILFLSAGGQSAGEPADLPAELQAIAVRMRTIQSLEVRMHQEKEMAAFGEVLKAEGKLVFARPRRLLMDLDGPGGTTLVINGDTMSTRYKALNKTEHKNLSRDPRARAVAEHLFLLLDADPEALSAVYRLQVLTTSPLKVRLVPKPEALARIIAHVDAKFDARGFVDELTLYESGGDTTRWRFDTPRINFAVDASRFRIDG